MPDPVLRPVSLDLDAAIKKAIADVPADARGFATATVTQSGAEISAAWKPRSNVALGGYAARLWGGGFQYGARAQIRW